MQTFYIIGISDNRNQFLSPEIRNLVSQGKVFSGGKRHHELVHAYLPEDAVWIDITVPLDAVFCRYEEHSEIIVFASGDPLFFGFANTVMRKLPSAKIILFPTFNSLQMLAHRILLPYQEMQTLSLTGRPWDAFDSALIRGDKLIGVLTDREKTPATIAARMLEYGYDNYRMTVGEALGNGEEESVRTFSLEEASQSAFRFPNCLILQRNKVHPRPFGIPESEFHLLNGRNRMITKMPVRLLTLSMLTLREKKSFWDIGFCTGSVSIEAKLQFPELKVTAFEQRPEGKELMERKRVKNINVRIKPERIYVSADYTVPLEYIERFLLSKGDYIFRALEKYNEGKYPPMRGTYEEGDIIYILGQRYVLNLEKIGRASCRERV